MSLVDHLLETRTPLELAKDLAKDLAKHAHERARLLDRVNELEVELFWMKVAERDAASQKNAVIDMDK